MAVKCDHLIVSFHLQKSCNIKGSSNFLQYPYAEVLNFQGQEHLICNCAYGIRKTGKLVLSNL